MRHGVKLMVRQLSVSLHLDESSLVTSRVAVVGATERSDTQAVVLDGIAVLANLVRPNNGSDLVQLAPSSCDVGSEAEPNTTL